MALKREAFMREKITSVSEVCIIITSALAWATAIIFFHQQILDRWNSNSFRNAYYDSPHLLQCLCIQGNLSQRNRIAANQDF